MQQSFDLRLLNMFLAAFYFFDKKLLSLTKKKKNPICWIYPELYQSNK